MLDRPFARDGRHPADGLCRKVRQLLETAARYSEMASNTLPQLEGALEHLREAVLIVTRGNSIVVANESARRLLAAGKSIQGRRLEQILRSADFLDYVGELKSGHPLERREVEITRGRSTVWLEASGSPIRTLDSAEQGLTILVLHDITRLKELEKLRKDFVANVSHELKTPLTVIKGFSETLAEDYDSLPAESRKRFFQKILSNVERLNVLIEDLLTLSRLESGPGKIQRTAHHLPTLVREVIENFESRLIAGKQTFQIEIEPGVEFAHIDPVRVAQAFENLIDNAFRYATHFTRITVDLRFAENRNYIRCSVSDDGIGIPPKDLPHIFERFYRVDKGRSRERGGTGLGLSIVKHIVLLHTGEVHAESEPGKGATISFTLPVASVR